MWLQENVLESSSNKTANTTASTSTATWAGHDKALQSKNITPPDNAEKP
jgi:hypothetical protein